ncbi:response regulator [Cohnella cellulosilytica]|uniref:Response regulator n=1 Tax=Cohnella cellulosilytica TaxID=986710 RepID=A0ABW2FHF7_9BACL
MYSIFLVDDEELELEMMRDFIRWEDMGIYVAGVGVNGKDAQEKIQAIQPDIVLTDVQMPLMDGLELAKWVSEQYAWMQIVFLTGHDEFAYVKSALHVGAVGYLLKPLDLEEISGVMERVKRKCEEARLKNKSLRVTKANLLKELLDEKEAGRRDNLAAGLLALERRASESRYALALCCVDRDFSAHAGETGALSRLADAAEDYFRELGLEVAIVRHREDELAIFREAGESDATREQWAALGRTIRGRLGLSATIAVGGEYAEPGRIDELYGQVRSLGDERFYLGPGQVIETGDVKPGYSCDTLPPFPEERWLSDLQQSNREEAERKLAEYGGNLRQLRIGRAVVSEWAIGLLARLEELLHPPGLGGHAAPGKRAALYHAVYDCQTLQGIEAIIRQAAEQYMNLLEERSGDKNAKLVRRVCEIIDRSYHEPITINGLSAQVYLSPNYLRSLFREKTGMTIHDYLTRIRLDKAKEMLADPALKVQDIAQKIGYESASYFISLFLKNQGVTPNEYRKNLR